MTGDGLCGSCRGFRFDTLFAPELVKGASSWVAVSAVRPGARSPCPPACRQHSALRHSASICRLDQGGNAPWDFLLGCLAHPILGAQQRQGSPPLGSRCREHLAQGAFVLWSRPAPRTCAPERTLPQDVSATCPSKAPSGKSSVTHCLTHSAPAVHRRPLRCSSALTEESVAFGGCLTPVPS